MHEICLLVASDTVISHENNGTRFTFLFINTERFKFTFHHITPVMSIVNKYDGEWRHRLFSTR